MARHLPTVIVLILMLVTCPVLGQGNIRKQVTPKDYHLWGTLWPNAISEKGGWVSYEMRYDSGKDTLFLRHISQKTKYAFAGARQGKFNGESIFAYMAADTLVIRDLSLGNFFTLGNVATYDFCGNGKYILASRTGTDQNGSLVLIRKDGMVVKEYGTVDGMLLNAVGDAMAYWTQGPSGNAMHVVYLGREIGEETIISDPAETFQNPVWQGQTLAFTSKGSVTRLYRYTTGDKKLEQCPYLGGKEKALEISSAYNGIFISADQQRIFFLLQDTKPLEHSAAEVQVWDAADSQLYPNKQLYGDRDYKDKMGIWIPAEGHAFCLNDRESPFESLSGDAKALIVSCQASNPVMGQQHDSRDYGIIDVFTGKKRNILTNNNGSGFSVMASPAGRYIAYPKGGDWWVYDIHKGTHSNITGHLTAVFYKEDHDKPSPAPMYGLAGWTKSDESVIVYDRYDLWEIRPDGKTTPRRLTRGREKNIVYRIAKDYRYRYLGGRFMNLVSETLNTKDGLLLSTYKPKDETTGYSFWNIKKGLMVIANPGRKKSYFLKAMKSNGYVYMEEDYQTPAQLIYGHVNGKSKQVVYQSNSHQSEYFWGHSEKISFAYGGKELSAALFYPAGFIKGKKYPMIVHIYERQSPYVNDYVRPTLLDESGFNLTNYTCEGYLILLPDIAYSFGETGKSATGSVLAAVDKVIGMGIVKPDKLGLIGHSFGGYETDIIITQTDRFTAAVSGAAWTDLVSTYHHIGQNTMTADSWRLNYDQLRIGKTPYQDSDAYMRNSPVLQAEKVTTPLLSWVGLKDKTIDPGQSIEFYLALRQLGKCHTLLVYPKEYHAVIDPANQVDLSMRIQKWFGLYLKGEVGKP